MKIAVNFMVAVFASALVSSAYAAPLLGTKLGFADSPFCYKHDCTYITSAPVKTAGLPEDMAKSMTGWTEETFRLRPNVSVKVTRDSKGVARTAHIQFKGITALKWAHQTDGYYVSDFVMTFTGEKPAVSLNKACLNDLLNSGQDSGIIIENLLG